MYTILCLVPCCFRGVIFFFMTDVILPPSLVVAGMVSLCLLQVPDLPKISGSLPEVSGDVSVPSVGGGLDVDVAAPAVAADVSVPSASVDLPGECEVSGVLPSRSFVCASVCLSAR